MNTKWIRLVFTGLLVVILLLGSSSLAFAGGGSNLGKMPLEKARQVLEEKLLGFPGIAGIAHLEQAGEIIVFLENELAQNRIPAVFEGFAVRTEVTGLFKARSAAAPVAEAPVVAYDVSAARLNPVDPLVGGVSVSAYVAGQSWAGTLGMVTYDNMILSNAHVLALDLNNNFLSAGTTPVIQPGAYDWGTLDSDRVGALSGYIPITFSRKAQNKADAAIASIDFGVGASPGEQFGESGNFFISGTTTVAAGDAVTKSGRTTGVTTSTVYLTNASTTVDYGGGKVARFVDQIIIYQPFSGSGDSGSAVAKDGKFVGLVFAGSTSYSIVCKASYIIDGLGIAVEPTTPKVLESIAVAPATASIAMGATQQFTATGTYVGGTTADMTSQVTWASRDDGVAVIDASGLATGISVGSAAITANYGVFSDTASLQVNGAPVNPTANVSISMDKASRTAGKNLFGWATAAVTVGVPGATVEGHWSSPVTSAVSGVADSSGTVTFTSASYKNPAGLVFTFVVDNVIKDGVFYDLAGTTSETITW
ncbi:MAG: Ig-like domain-containing protein [Dehalococcoidaceae bacterium]|nr:Ig-like domain-containing protein [Dehalococcoidaceae bacterium]